MALIHVMNPNSGIQVRLLRIQYARLLQRVLRAHQVVPLDLAAGLVISAAAAGLSVLARCCGGDPPGTVMLIIRL